MIWAITMPTWGLSMEEGTIAAWRIPEGGQTARGAELVDIETSKIANSLEAQHEGVLRRQIVKAGQTVRCGELIGILASHEVPDAEIDEFISRIPRPLPADSRTDETPSLGSMRLIELPFGARIRCTAIGDAGPAVVFLHGFGGDSSSWLFNQSHIAAKHRTFALDLPGHGGSSKQMRKGSIEELAGAIEAALDYMELQRIHLVGHSMGAAVTLALSERQPQRVTSVSLLAPFAFGSAVNGRYVANFISAQRSRDLKQCLGLLFATPTAIPNEMIDAVLRYKWLDGVSDALEKIANAVFREPAPTAMSAQLKGLRNRMLLIRGSQDQILSGAQTPEGVRLETLALSGHMPHMEEPSVVNGLLLEHFEQTERVSAEVP